MISRFEFGDPISSNDLENTKTILLIAVNLAANIQRRNDWADLEKITPFDSAHTISSAVGKPVTVGQILDHQKKTKTIFSNNSHLPTPELMDLSR